jgi:hypothetical protein
MKVIAKMTKEDWFGLPFPTVLDNKFIFQDGTTLQQGDKVIIQEKEWGSVECEYEMTVIEIRYKSDESGGVYCILLEGVKRNNSVQYIFSNNSCSLGYFGYFYEWQKLES